MIKRLYEGFSRTCRSKRAALFRRYMHPTEEDKILDLGSEDGRLIAETVPFRENVVLADIDEQMLARGRARYGFKTVLLDESGALPFEDGSFDIVHCSSVIEHVTVDKGQRWSREFERNFAEVAFERQSRFASEIRRVGRSYFVQTPNRNFLIESHSWLPLVQFLPRSLLLKTIRFSNKWWVKKTSADWNLLTEMQLNELFPKAIIVRERVFGLTKSLMAIGGTEQRLLR